MGTGNTDRILVRLHDNAPGLSPLKDGDTGSACSRDLGIIVVNGSGTDHAVGTGNILSPMADVYTNSLADQFISRNRRIHIRAGNFKAHALQNQTQRAHRNAADAYQMYTLTGNQMLFYFLSQTLIHIDHILRYVFISI